MDIQVVKKTAAPSEINLDSRPSNQLNGFLGGFANSPQAIGRTVRIPSVRELTYEIFDLQRDMISAIEPKRYKCSIPTPYAYIEKLYKDN